MEIDRSQPAVARLLGELSGGGDEALDELFTLLYDELSALARRHRQRWHGIPTLNTTALVHEAYIRLAARQRMAVTSRAHFSALAARVMRQILCNHARDRRARKRGGGIAFQTLDEANMPADERSLRDDPADRLIALDDALRRLEQLDARRSRVVECRFFGGLTIEETAEAIGASPRTVKRDWFVAQAWLQRELGFGT